MNDYEPRDEPLNPDAPPISWTYQRWPKEETRRMTDQYAHDEIRQLKRELSNLRQDLSELKRTIEQMQRSQR